MQNQNKKLTEIPKDQLHNHFGIKLIVKEGNSENVVVFEKITGGWLCGISITNNSALQILINSKQDEHSPKYFLE